MKFRTLVAPIAIVFAVAAGISVFAHEMTVMGTVVGIEAARIQVKTGKEKTGESPAWYPIDEKTKIKRGTKSVTLAEVKIKVDERVVVVVDHPDKGPMKTKEIRLAVQ